MHSSTIQIRDPFVLPVLERGLYYLYGTTDKDPWNKRGTGFEAYTSRDLIDWDGPHRVFSPPRGFWGTHDFWAPEVHRYRNKFYMFATFISPGKKRATHILVADDPLGPFLPVSGNPATPEGWQCLDGTLFVEQPNQQTQNKDQNPNTSGDRPWIVFCREWVEVNDGEIWASPLSADLSGLEGEPQLLFRASSAPWTQCLPRRDGSGLLDARVTDGPFLHRTESGILGMVWSSIGSSGYAMGWAQSTSGSIVGPWIQSLRPIISEDGGHGMLFRTFDGDLYLTFHKPNRTPDERFFMMPILEKDLLC